MSVPRFRPTIRPISLLLAVAALSLPAAYASSPGGELSRQMPAQWQYTPEFQQTSPDDDTWWTRLGDPVLDSLIAIGVESNLDVVAAVSRMESARAQMQGASSAYFPTIGINAGWQRERTSGRTAGPDGQAVTMSYFSAGASISWEIDLFGRIGAKVRQARTGWEASRADRDAMLVSVAAEIASTYIQVRVWQAELAVANAHIESQLKVVKIAEARHEAGLSSALDVAQARTVYYSTVATVPGLQNSIHTGINSLATLLGIYAADLPAGVTEPRQIPDAHMIVATGIPADLLRRRPDIMAAERRMASAAATLGVARKEFLPSLTINGEISTAAHKAGDLFTRPSLGYSVAPTLSWTLFSGMARKAAVAEARAELHAQWADYNSTVINAVTEADNAMSGYLAALRSADEIARVVDESEKALKLSTDLYKSGNTSFTNVADAQMNYLQYSNSLLAARGQALAALISLYKALGGGWQYSSSL